MSTREEMVRGLSGLDHLYHAPEGLDDGEYDGGGTTAEQAVRLVVPLEEATVISSATTAKVAGVPDPFGPLDDDGMPDFFPSPIGEVGEPVHTIMLDIDHPAVLIPSSTPDHYHLYIDVPVGWSKYAQLIDLLGEMGVLEPGYAAASLARKATHLRLPDVKKPDVIDERS